MPYSALLQCPANSSLDRDVQVEGSSQRLCQSLGGEVHRLALQVQVLEESDTHAIEAEAVRGLYPCLPA